MPERFLWRFPYLERNQGVLDGVRGGPVGPLGPLELAAPSVTVKSAIACPAQFTHGKAKPSLAMGDKVIFMRSCIFNQ